MTNKPTPASQPSPAPTVLDRAKAMYASWANSQPDRCSIPPWEKATQGAQMEWKERAREPSPARSDKDAEKICPNNFGNPHDYSFRDDGLCSYCDHNEESGMAERAPSGESIDTPEFDRLLNEYADSPNGNTTRALIEHVNAALARRATAGTTAAPSSEPECRGCDPAEGFCRACREAERATAGNAVPTEAAAIAEIKRRLKVLIGHGDALQEGYGWALAMVENVEAEFASNTATAAPGDLPREWVQKTWFDCNQDVFAFTRAVLASNAGATPRPEQVNEMRIALTVQLDELIDLGDRYARRMKGKDDDESRYAQGAIDYARKVAAPYKYNGPYRSPSINPPVGAKEKE